MTATVHKCQNCGFFDNHLCRRNPPVLIDEDGFAIWPSVGSPDWCGEFSPISQDSTGTPPPRPQETANAAKPQHNHGAGARCGCDEDERRAFLAGYAFGFEDGGDQSVPEVDIGQHAAYDDDDSYEEWQANQ